MSKYEREIDLFGDYTFRSVHEKDDFLDSVYLYFHSKKFSRLMQDMFRGESNIFQSYLPRKLINDDSGCLAMGMPLLEFNESKNAEFFLNSGEEIEVNEYFKAVSELRNPEDLLVHLFHNEKKMVADIERYWVYLYLLCECGIRNVSALLTDTRKQYDKRWGSDRAVDQVVVAEFLRTYEKI